MQYHWIIVLLDYSVTVIQCGCIQLHWNAVTLDTATLEPTSAYTRLYEGTRTPARRPSRGHSLINVRGHLRADLQTFAYILTRTHIPPPRVPREGYSRSSLPTAIGALTVISVGICITVRLH